MINCSRSNSNASSTSASNLNMKTTTSKSFSSKKSILKNSSSSSTSSASSSSASSNSSSPSIPVRNQSIISNKECFELNNNKIHLPSPRLNKRYKFSIIPTNEELNNKIDLEIRILDGILKLLNAICSAPPPSITSNNLNINNNGNSNQVNLLTSSATSIASSVSSTASTSTGASQIFSSTASFNLLNDLDALKVDSLTKCNEIGIAIANAIVSNSGNRSSTNETTSNSSSSSSNQQQVSSTNSIANSLIDINSLEYNHIFQILTACKCLFVSHRKIAIYLHNLHEFEKQNKKQDNETDNIEEENDVEAILRTKQLISLNNTCKLMLSDIRVPLSWNWTDYVKATKSSANISAKFATFAIIYLGNMIYDTQLMSNIDASTTDINFNETFVFDDVKPKNFEIVIEFYSYELFNTTNNIMQSARKLAKQFSDFATFKKHQNQSNHNQLNPSSLFNNALTNSTNYSCSINKFKCIAKAILTQDDIGDQVQTKCLKLLNDSNLDQMNGVTSYSSNHINTNSSTNSTNVASAKLPLFDYYSCNLRILPTSSYI